MQPAIRALRLYGGALRVPSATRGIHSTAVNPNPAIVAGSRHSTETLSSHDVTQSRNITTVIGAKPLTSSTKIHQFGPRAKANFNTSIARQDLGFMPFESNIIFPNIENVSLKESFKEIRVPFLPDNFHPARKPEPEVKVSRPVIATVADSTTHIAAPSAIMEGLTFNISFVKEFEVAKEAEEDLMMRAFRV